jgi:hypothetical protein
MATSFAEMSAQLSGKFTGAVGAVFNVLMSPVFWLVAVTVAIVGYFGYEFWRQKSTDRILLFEGGKLAHIVEKKLAGLLTFKIGEKTYSLEKAQRLLFRDIWGLHAFYIFHDNVPISFVLDPDSKQLKVSGELLSALIEQKHTENILRAAKTQTLDMLMWIGVGALLGVLATVAAFATKIIKL